MCAKHPFLGEPCVLSLIMLGRLVDNISFGSPLAYVSLAHIGTNSSGIFSICYLIPNDHARTRWHCSLIATSTTPCSHFCTPKRPLTVVLRHGEMH